MEREKKALKSESRLIFVVPGHDEYLTTSNNNIAMWCLMSRKVDHVALLPFYLERELWKVEELLSDTNSCLQRVAFPF
jgi:hypothetical protein